MNRIIPVFLFSAVLLLGLSGTAIASKPDFAKKNQPSYWGNCYKLEINEDVQKYTVTDPDATKVIVKGGPDRMVYEVGPFVDLTAPLNPKNNKHYGISHIIICTDDSGNQDSDDDGHVDGDTDKDDDETDTKTDKNDEKQILADTDRQKPETLPATGSPVLANALLGGTISSAAGYLHLLSRHQSKRIKEIEEIAL